MKLFYYPEDFAVALGPFNYDINQLKELFNEWGEGQYHIESSNPLLCRKGYVNEWNITQELADIKEAA